MISKSRFINVRMISVTLLVLSGPAVFFNRYWLYLALQVLIYGIACLGLYVIYGLGGQLSLAHAAFMGVGAYSTVVLSELLVAPGLHLLISLALVALFALILALPALRLSGFRLAIVTLAFGELFVWWLTNNSSLTGGPLGTKVEAVTVLGLSLKVPLYGYLFTAVLVLVVLWIVNQISHSQFGRGLTAIRDSPLIASSVAIPSTRTKILSFVLGSIFAGLAGWLQAATTPYITPDQFGLMPSVYLLAAVVIGGSRSIVGIWLGAIFIVLLPEAFNLFNQPNLYPFVGGVILTIVILVAPNGLASLWTKASQVGRKSTRNRA